MISIIKLRKRTVLVFIAMAVAMLAFIIGDMLTAGQTVFGGSDKTTIASFGGESINSKEYQQILTQLEQNAAQRGLQTETAFFHEQAWTTLMAQKVQKRLLDRLNISVTTDEMVKAIMGDNPHPFIKNLFINPQTQQFSKEDVIRVINEKEENPEMEKQWLLLENGLRETLLSEKLGTLFNKSQYAPKALKEYFGQLNSQVVVSADLEYMKYETIKDESITISDEELKKHYEKKKNLFKRDPFRILTFVSLKTTPSKSDSLFAYTRVKDLYESYSQAKNDSLFLSRIDKTLQFSRFAKLESLELPKTLQETLEKKSKTGFESEIELINDTYYKVKVLATATRTDSVKLSQIVFVKNQETGEVNKNLADSIYNVLLQNPSKFSELASAFSEDNNTAPKGGDIGWIAEKDFDQALADDVFASNKKMRKIENPNATYIINVTERTKRVKKYKIAVFKKEILVSSETNKYYYQKAQDLRAKLTDVETFSETARENGYQVLSSGTIGKNDFRINPIGNSRELVRWAYESQKSDISDIYTVDDQYIIAQVLETQDGEYTDFEAVKSPLKTLLLRDKKYEEMKSKSSSEFLKKTVENISLSASGFEFASFDPILVGAVIGGDESGTLIQGMTGAAKISNIKKQKAETQGPGVGLQYHSPSAYPLNYWIGLIEKEPVYELKDNRYNFY